jgi:hypothetical protein
MTDPTIIPIERAINAARRLKLRSQAQREVVDSLIYHLDMLSITVRNQRKQLADLNKKATKSP